MLNTSDGAERTPRILLVDDERDLLEVLAFLVGQAGFVAVCATDPAEALEAFERDRPRVAVVDLNLKPWDGLEVVVELRRRDPRLPILVLTAKATEDDKVKALESGADDYVVKPFGHRELVARIKAHARRAELDVVDTAAPPFLEVGPLRLHLDERTIEINGEEGLRLTGTEFRVLEYLMRNSGTVVPTDTLAKQVWGYNDPPARDVVRVTIHRLRRKLGGGNETRNFIRTVPGVGLQLRVTGAEQASPRRV